jgi:hypothetical protein
MLEKRNKISFEWEFFIFKTKIEIENYMNKVSGEKNKQRTKINVKSVYFFSQSIKTFESKIQVISEKCFYFWKELIKMTDMDANSLHNVGSEITFLNIDLNH